MSKSDNTPKEGILFRLILISVILSAFLFFFWVTYNENQIVIDNCEGCNVLLISIDTLRQDRVSGYGYEKNTTPNIDAVMKKGVVFTNAVTTSTWTLPSHMSLFTATYPHVHKITNKFLITEDGNEKIANLKEISPGIKTMAQVFKANGYVTSAFTGGSGLNRQFGFDSGFEKYLDDRDFAGFEYTTSLALEWIKENKDRKMFVFLHGYDVHGQFTPPEGYDFRYLNFEYKGNLDGSTDEQKLLREDALLKGGLFLRKDDINFLSSLYDEKINRADKILGDFLEEYAKLGLIGNTLIIITSDHGEEIYEHGRIDHGHSLYDELVKIPLIISFPGLPREQYISNQVRNIDIMPTVLDILNMNIDSNLKEQMSGVSVIPLIKGRDMDLTAFLETDYRYAVFLRGVRTTNGWKYIKNIETGEKELFELDKDLNEKINLVNKNLKKVNDFDNLLNSYLHPSK